MHGVLMGVEIVCVTVIVFSSSREDFTVGIL